MVHRKLAIPVLLLAVSILLTIAVIRSSGAGDGFMTNVAPLADGVMMVVGGATSSFMKTLRMGQERAPAVVVGLAAVILVPLIAFFMVVVRRVQYAAALRQEQASQLQQAEVAAGLPRLSNAWIDINGARRFRLAGELLRIGRDEENDLKLEDPNVHRHHALIQRTPDAEFILLDVSGEGGNGMVVNGRRMRRARLKDGDMIELGNTRVRFHCEPISRTMAV